jgi:hypothetical protein
MSTRSRGGLTISYLRVILTFAPACTNHTKVYGSRYYLIAVDNSLGFTSPEGENTGPCIGCIWGVVGVRRSCPSANSLNAHIVRARDNTKWDPCHRKPKKSEERRH